MIKRIYQWLLGILGIGTITVLAIGAPSDQSFIARENVIKTLGIYKIQYADTGEVEIPDIDKPKAKLKKWDGEVSMEIALRTDKKVKAKEENGKLKWKSKTKEVHLYPLEVNEQMEYGGFEFEIILKEKPDTNIITFDIVTKNLNFLYQPALTQEEIDYGDNRPNNVVGSYAVYHSTKKDNKYKAGKAFHIYRPQMEDADGNTIWGELNITNNTLEVQIPQNFLDSAKYPIQHAAGLTFGHTAVGATDSTLGGNTLRGSYAWTPASNGTLDDIRWYARNTGDNPKVRAILYKNSDNTLIAVGSEEGVATGGSWEILNISNESINNSTAYMICFWISSAGNFPAKFDGDASYNLARDNEAYHATNNPPDPIDWDAGKPHLSGRKYSAYASYTLSAGVVTPSPTQSPLIFQ
jgi:hypothetical protein